MNQRSSNLLTTLGNDLVSLRQQRAWKKATAKTVKTITLDLLIIEARDRTGEWDNSLPFHVRLKLRACH